MPQEGSGEPVEPSFFAYFFLFPLIEKYYIKFIIKSTQSLLEPDFPARNACFFVLFVDNFVSVSFELQFFFVIPVPGGGVRGADFP
jgi:hypothetical protein